MVASVKEFEKKLIDNDLNRKKLAEEIGMTPTTLTSKVEKSDSDFKLSEMVVIANKLHMNQEEFILIFFGEKLSFNESKSA
jgi:predicted transcriptional regulator